MTEDVERTGARPETVPDTFVSPWRTVEETLHALRKHFSPSRHVESGDPVLSREDIREPGDLTVEADPEAERQLSVALDSVRQGRSILYRASSRLEQMSGKAHEISAVYRAGRQL